MQRPLCPGGWLRNALHLPEPVIVGSVLVPALQGEARKRMRSQAGNLEGRCEYCRGRLRETRDRRASLRSMGMNIQLSMIYNRENGRQSKFSLFGVWLNTIHPSNKLALRFSQAPILNAGDTVGSRTNEQVWEDFQNLFLIRKVSC